MKIFFTLFFFSLVFPNKCFAQYGFQISTLNPTSADFNFLLLQNKNIASNDTINERIIDLVQPALLDSMIERRIQHHKIFGIGWLIHAFGGYNWRAVSMKKEKYVGTVIRNTRSNEERYTEYDINFDLNFHLRKYLFHVFQSYDLQKEIGKQDYRKGNYLKDYSAPPFVRDTNQLDITKYRMHCEYTPLEKYRVQLNELFYPTLPDGGALKDHPNFGVEFPSMGFYGVPCLDCNHSCHPEIHPYEWAWWLKATPQDETTKKTWCIGLFHEGSNRMKKWSRNPMAGSISIPFAYENASDSNRYLSIDIDHLVYGEFFPEQLKSISTSEKFMYADAHAYEAVIQLNDSTQIIAEINFAAWLNTQGLKFWFSNLNYDESKNILSGYFHFATVVNDLYTARITFDALQYEYED